MLDSKNPAGLEELERNLVVEAAIYYFDVGQEIEINTLRSSYPTFFYDDLLKKIDFLFILGQDQIAASIFKNGRVYLYGTKSLYQATSGSVAVVSLLHDLGIRAERGIVSQVQLSGRTSFGMDLNLSDIAAQNTNSTLLDEDIMEVASDEARSSVAKVRSNGEVILRIKNIKVGEFLESLSELDGLPFFSD